MHRIYENDDITVFWDSEKCVHSRNCVMGAPDNFNVNKKPWVNLENADAAKVWQALDKCPDKALSCVYNHDIKVILEEDNCRSAAYDAGKKIGECDYKINGETITMFHTEVDPEYGGKSIAKRLAYKVIEMAEKKKLTINPTCSYVAKILGGG